MLGHVVVGDGGNVVVGDGGDVVVGDVVVGGDGDGDDDGSRPCCIIREVRWKEHDARIQ